MNHEGIGRAEHEREATRPSAGPASEDARFEQLAARLRDGLPGHLAMELVILGSGHAVMQMQIQSFHTAANGYLHAGAVVALADTACGFGCFANLPDGAYNFTTVELKSNFLSRRWMVLSWPMPCCVMAANALKSGTPRCATPRNVYWRFFAVHK